jgi:SAM-dependent methyltransferase
MVVLPPGTLLQLMYLDERLKGIKAGRFIEIGAGSGEITNRLLKAGWSGTVYDLSGTTINHLKQRFSAEINANQLTIVLGDFLSCQQSEHVDLIISCMVMEHLDSEAEKKFMNVAALHLNTSGRVIGLVPASPDHWGIEDEIAGHCRRYSTNHLLSLFDKTGWQLDHVAGLTYPISNLLLPISNYLVRRSEANKLTLSMLERTKHSGHRNVRFKTHFPAIMKLFLNECTLLPLHWLQKFFAKSSKALVIYFEAIYQPQGNVNDK